MTVRITALEEFIAVREEWLKNQLDNCGLTTPVKAYAWAFQSPMTQETYAEIRVGQTLLHYLQEDDQYDTSLLILAGQQHTELPIKAVLKALSSINYALTA